MKHTKEPWHYEINGFSRAILLGDKLTSIGYISDIVNTERIVACVNACAGITNEALEKGIVLSSVEKECWKWMHDNNLRYKDGSERDFEWHGVKVWEDV